jgi:carboxyl-terminal processing protease
LALGASTFAGRSAVARVHAPVRDAATANVVRLTASVLEHSQLAHRRLDAGLAREFLARYLDALDGSHSLFLRSDEAGFQARSASLAEAIHVGDSSMARDVFERYLQRLAQRAAFVAQTLRGEPMTFTGHEDYALDRRRAERPRDMAAARSLWLQQLRAEYLDRKLEDRAPAQIADMLTHRYEQQLRTMRNLGSDEVLSAYLDVLAHVYDPHSDYMGRQDMESFSIAMNLSLFGIGATLEDEDGYCTIRELLPGGPAARSGLLKPGDRIVAVAPGGREPVDVVSMPLSRAVELIRGPRGTTVTLTIARAGAPDTAVSVVRDRVNLEDQEAKASVVDLASGDGRTLRLGIVRLPSFYGDTDGPGGRSASADVARLLEKLDAEHVQGIVLDLRDDPGGSLREAVRVTGLFIRQGPVVQTRDGQGDVEVASDTDPAVAYDGPLVVLTSGFSASASEIVAGALQDYGRAVIVGDSSTFGKGSVQEVIPLARLMDRMGLGHAHDPGALKVTISKFYRPDGASTQLRGVVSDIVIPSPERAAHVAESTLDGALSWDQIPPAQHERMDRVRPYLAELRRLSARRLDTTPGLRDLEAEVTGIGQRDASKRISLNETERRAELAHAKEENAALERDDKAEAAAGSVSRLITLEQASHPGLPSAAPPSSVASAAADDIVLHEAERILRDYAGMLGG